MATLEAMATGIPVLGNRHSTSPVEHGVSRFLSDEPLELRQFAQPLLGDRGFAMRMGREGQRADQERFSTGGIQSGLTPCDFDRASKGARATNGEGEQPAVITSATCSEN